MFRGLKMYEIQTGDVHLREEAKPAGLFANKSCAPLIPGAAAATRVEMSK